MRQYDMEKEMDGDGAIHLEDGARVFYPATENQDAETMLCCCDCGLIHKVKYERSHRGEKEGIWVTFRRMTSLTNRLRDIASKVRTREMGKEIKKWKEEAE